MQKIFKRVSKLSGDIKISTFCVIQKSKWLPWDIDFVYLKLLNMKGIFY